LFRRRLFDGAGCGKTGDESGEKSGIEINSTKRLGNVQLRIKVRNMRITILTTGSRGDVQPFIALGLGLQQAGHQVKLVTHDPFQAMVQSYGLEFAAMGGDVQAVMAQEAGQKMLETSNPVQLIQRYAQMVAPLLAQAMADSWQACQDTDLIIGTAYTIWGFDIAQKLKIPFCMAALLPQSANSEFPFPSLRQTLKLGGWLNSLTYPILLEGFGWVFRKGINQFRQATLQLTPLSNWEGLYGRLERAKVPYLYGFSSIVVPKPANWSKRLHITGYWFLEHLPTWTPPTDLQQFLAQGAPPVYIGFGSMTGRDPERMTEIALAALAKTKQRGMFNSVLVIGLGVLFTGISWLCYRFM
jgi:UDP:flavonoid glycosyltransferase YjiC (YdhE family)